MSRNAESGIPQILDHYIFRGKLPTYLSPKPTLKLTSHLGQNVGLREGLVGSFPGTDNDPKFITCGIRTPAMDWNPESKFHWQGIQDPG